MPPVHSEVEPALRSAYAEALAALARHTRDVTQAEDRLHDAIVEALRTWPRDGIPDRPAAWLATVGRNRSHDRHRRDKRHERYTQSMENPVVPVPDRWDDDLLRLLAVVCHPELAPADRAVLALHTVLGLSTSEVAAAFLTTASAMERRVTRARARLRERAGAFEVPDRTELAVRLPSMLDAAHALFTQGHWSEDAIRPQLCALAESIVHALADRSTEARALLSLMWMHRARLPARMDQGRPVPLPDQDRRRWDGEFHARALAILPDEPGPYALEAHISATHMAASSAAVTDWVRIDALYEALEDLRPTAPVRMNRALAHGFAFGAQAGLQMVEPLLAQRTLADFPYVHLVHAELLWRAGRALQAHEALDRAQERARNAVEEQQIASRRVDWTQER